MNYNLEKKENGVIEANIALDKEAWDKALTSAYEKNKGKYNIPGFRKGHAPRNIIEKTYGAGAFFNDAIDEVSKKLIRRHPHVFGNDLDAPNNWEDIKKQEKADEALLILDSI